MKIDHPVEAKMTNQEARQIQEDIQIDIIYSILVNQHYQFKEIKQLIWELSEQ